MPRLSLPLLSIWSNQKWNLVLSSEVIALYGRKLFIFAHSLLPSVLSITATAPHTWFCCSCRPDFIQYIDFYKAQRVRDLPASSCCFLPSHLCVSTQKLALSKWEHDLSCTVTQPRRLDWCWRARLVKMCCLTRVRIFGSIRLTEVMQVKLVPLFLPRLSLLISFSPRRTDGSDESLLVSGAHMGLGCQGNWQWGPWPLVSGQQLKLRLLSERLSHSAFVKMSIRDYKCHVQCSVIYSQWLFFPPFPPVFATCLAVDWIFLPMLSNIRHMWKNKFCFSGPTCAMNVCSIPWMKNFVNLNLTLTLIFLTKNV